VFPFAKSLDTLGFFTDTARDMFAFWKAMGHPDGRPETFPIRAPDPKPDVEPAMAAAFRSSLERLRAAGIEIRRVDIASMLVRVREAQQAVLFYEGARVHEAHYKLYGDRLGAQLANLVREGLNMPVERYDAARRLIDDCRKKMTELYKATPVILAPGATGPAPLGLTSNGDSRLNGPWTALGTPAITVPMPVGDNMPMGLQITADHNQDARVLQTAMRLEQLLAQSAA
jgi:Asp-tRNA(Asn)/Glu-tRNA(Gln) amidotransferase A subunit family amidase